jgi:DNA-directed RNA polymerase sigma subunit (sigma70/sigma32)
MPQHHPSKKTTRYSDEDCERLAAAVTERAAAPAAETAEVAAARNLFGPRPLSPRARQSRLLSAYNDNNGDTAKQAIANVLIEQLGGFLPQLTPTQQSVIALSFGLPEIAGGLQREPLGLHQIAAQLGISFRAARTARDKGLRALRGMYGIEEATNPLTLAPRTDPMAAEQALAAAGSAAETNPSAELAEGGEAAAGAAA